MGFTQSGVLEIRIAYCHEPALIDPLTETVMILFFTAQTDVQFVGLAVPIRELVANGSPGGAWI